MPGFEWTSESRAELLAVLRSRLDAETIKRSGHLARTFGYAGEPTDDSFVADVTRAIETSITQVEDLPLHDALRLMTGLDAQTSSKRLTRNDVLDEMARVLPRKTGHADIRDLPLTRRQVQSLEIDELVPALITALDTPRRRDLAYHDVIVHVALRPGLTADRVSMVVNLTVTYFGDSWLVGVTHDEVLADYLCGVSDLVNEVICPGPEERTEVSPTTVRLALVPSPLRGARPLNIHLAELNGDGAADLIEQEWIRSFKGVAWFGTALNNNPDGLRLSFINEQQIRRSCRYCFWSAGRRMFVRSITIDASAFPRASQVEFSLQPFLASPMTMGNQEGMQIYEMNIDAWLHPGNGLALIWGDREEERAEV